MTILYPTTKTRQFYEANSTTRVLYASNLLVAPHALTMRFTYTVPAGRRAFITGSNLIMWRDTAAAPVGEYVNSLRVTINTVVANFRRLMSRDNNTYVYQSLALSEYFLMNAGDTIENMTFDGSTGGSCNYLAGITYVEFDI